MFDCLLLAWSKKKTWCLLGVMSVPTVVIPFFSRGVETLHLEDSPQKIICQFVIVNSIIPIWPTWLLENSRNFHWRSLKWEPCRVSSWHHFYCQEEPGSPRHKMRRLDEEISQRLGWKKWAKVQGSSLFSAMVPSLEIKALMRAYFHHWFSLIGLIKPLFPAGCVLGGG